MKKTSEIVEMINLNPDLLIYLQWKEKEGIRNREICFQRQEGRVVCDYFLPEGLSVADETLGDGIDKLIASYDSIGRLYQLVIFNEKGKENRINLRKASLT